MRTAAPPGTDSTAPIAATAAWPAVVAVTAGIFAIVTTEILPIGLLTEIGADFTISDGTAGLTMTMPGLLAAVAAPVATVATARVDRRIMLCAFILLLAVANFLAAAATGYWVLLASRVLVGITIGGFWSIGAGLAGRLVPPASVAKATAVIFASVPLGSVLGVPAGTFIGGIAGWRTAFVVLGVLSTAALVALLLTVPRLPAERPTRASELTGLLRTTGTRSALVLTFLVVTAHFGAYTYVTPFLEDVSGAGPGTVTTVLLVYGAAGMVGNFVCGATVSSYPRATFAAVAAAVAAATLLLPVLGRDLVGALALLILWGAAYGGVPVCSQTWFAKAAPRSAEAASVLFTASFQATIALGALTGGLVVDHSAPATVMTLAGVTAALAVVVVAAHRSRRVVRPQGG
ncbi:Predicted arabinose efflux permease, MFS family [Glycomyces sambucus]|uniref:Predicted arabinose efflux permease, MFS family n=1 Tax=Glycomyces sambucus TaxID=380244 RepID=A0A1G9G437_9ACTN|nr:MFS transporter [Glycomyces sambucus]SDK95406.1 Predicted arabinose efflux permease, MFS family [Glycomyces sambucus]